MPTLSGAWNRCNLGSMFSDPSLIHVSHQVVAKVPCYGLKVYVALKMMLILNIVLFRGEAFAM